MKTQGGPPKQTDMFVSMLGFARRANKIVYGLDNLSGARAVKLLAVSDTASDNLAGAMARLAEQRGLPLVTAPALEMSAGNNIKALGFTDANMAKAIADYCSGADTKYKFKPGKRR